MRPWPRRLPPTGRQILILERGEHLTPSAHDRSDKAIFADGHFRPKEEWLDGEGKPFNPGNYYYVGGNSKFYGAVLLRYRREDFAPWSIMGGITPGWPISYDDLEPYYSAGRDSCIRCAARSGEDPTEPPHSSRLSASARPGRAADCRPARAAGQGRSAPVLPAAGGRSRPLAGAGAQTPWDAFPDTTGGKMDAETVPRCKAALQHTNVHASHQGAGRRA